MNKKVIISWPYLLGLLLFEIAWFMLFFPFDTNSDNYLASMIFCIVMMIIIPILSNDYYFCTILTQNTIIFKHKYTGKKQQIEVGRINRFVIDVSAIDNPTQSWLIVYANQKKGQMLGTGNNVIMSLLKTYPHIPVVLKHFNIQLARRTAKYLVKHGKVSRHKCEELCKFYHLPNKLLEQADDGNNQ